MNEQELFELIQRGFLLLDKRLEQQNDLLRKILSRIEEIDDQIPSPELVKRFMRS